MFGINLEFAAGTAEDNKKVLMGALDPNALMRAYREARAKHRTHDIVLICPDIHDPHIILSGARETIRSQFKLPPDMFGISAHRQVQAPHDTDAFWVCVLIPGSVRPASAILFAIPYEQESVQA